MRLPTITARSGRLPGRRSVRRASSAVAAADRAARPRYRPLALVFRRPPVAAAAPAPAPGSPPVELSVYFAVRLAWAEGLRSVVERSVTPPQADRSPSPAGSGRTRLPAPGRSAAVGVARTSGPRSRRVAPTPAGGRLSGSPSTVRAVAPAGPPGTGRVTARVQRAAGWAAADHPSAARILRTPSAGPPRPGVDTGAAGSGGETGTATGPGRVGDLARASAARPAATPAATTTSGRAAPPRATVARRRPAASAPGVPVAGAPATDAPVAGVRRVPRTTRVRAGDAEPSPEPSPEPSSARRRIGSRPSAPATDRSGTGHVVADPGGRTPRRARAALSLRSRPRDGTTSGPGSPSGAGRPSPDRRPVERVHRSGPDVPGVAPRAGAEREQTPAPPAPQIDMDRLDRDLWGRFERRMRVERQRRGLR